MGWWSGGGHVVAVVTWSRGDHGHVPPEAERSTISLSTRLGCR